jgi:hypothetical protein
MKKTKRKGFNFFRSYYDVYNELKTNKEKVDFLDALFARQFHGEEPENLEGMAKFAYISQVNSIDTQVKGYVDRVKAINKNVPNFDPWQGVEKTILTPPQQEKEKVQEKEKEKEENNILLCSLSEKSELSEYGFIAFSFWQLFRKNLLELGRTKTTTLDKAKLSTWETDIRLMIESDKVTKDELKIVWKFLTKNDFWKPNILSTSKLREKFDQLISKANSENIKPNKQEPGSAADEWMQNKLKQLADEQRNN